jgi:hypothetical protein
MIPNQKKCPRWADALDIRRSALFKNERAVRHGTVRLANVNAVG